MNYLKKQNIKEIANEMKYKKYLQMKTTCNTVVCGKKIKFVKH